MSVEEIIVEIEDVLGKASGIPPDLSVQFDKLVAEYGVPGEEKKAAQERVAELPEPEPEPEPAPPIGEPVEETVETVEEEEEKPRVGNGRRKSS